MASMSCIFVNSGNASHKQATSPARFGHANEVPLPVAGLPFDELAITAFSPTETTLGFNSPAPLGPQLLLAAIFLFISIEPMVKALSASAGQPTNFPSPELFPLL